MSLQTLKFGLCFNESLLQIDWPSCLCLLSTDDRFNQALQNVCLPSGLRTVILGSVLYQCFDRVQVSVCDHLVRFIVEIQLHDTDCSPLRNGVQLGCHVLPDGCCVRLVAQRVGKTQVSERGLYGRRMLMDGDYCQVFSNTFKTWVTGTILDQGPDFWRVCFHHNHLQDCEKVTFHVQEQMTVLSLNLCSTTYLTVRTFTF